MKMFPTKFELYDDDEECIAVFNGFDKECMKVIIKNKILAPEELDEISGLFTLAYQQYRDGVKA